MTVLGGSLLEKTKVKKNTSPTKTPAFLMKVKPAPAPEPEPEPEAAASPEPEPEHNPSSGWLHPASVQKSEAEDMLAADNGLLDTGRFLVRASGPAYVISVVFKLAPKEGEDASSDPGTPTHHKCELVDDVFEVNQQATSCSTLAEVVDFLGDAHDPWWPLRLTTGIPPL